MGKPCRSNKMIMWDEIYFANFRFLSEKFQLTRASSFATTGFKNLISIVAEVLDTEDLLWLREGSNRQLSNLKIIHMPSACKMKTPRVEVSSISCFSCFSNLRSFSIIFFIPRHLTSQQGRRSQSLKSKLLNQPKGRRLFMHSGQCFRWPWFISFSCLGKVSSMSYNRTDLCYD